VTKAWSLSAINVDGGDGRRLLQGVNAADLAWSPDGSQIAYAAQIGGQWDIYIVPARGGKPRRLTVSSSDERYPAWSPDGNAIAYSATSGMRPGLFVIPRDGNIARRLTSTEETAHPTWSPDRSQIVYTARIGGQWDIHVIPALGGDPQRLTVSKGNDVSPAWSPGIQPVAPAAGTDVCLQRDMLRIGVSVDYPALGTVQDNPDVVHGFGVELANLLLEGKGIRHNFHGAPLELLIGPLVRGDYDLIISQMPINEVDAKDVNFSDPYFVIKQTFTIRQADKKQLQTLADLRGRVVGVTQGKQGVEIAALLKKEFGGDLAVQTFAGGIDAMQALVDRKVDAVIEDNLFALNFVVQHKDMNLIAIETQRTITPLGIAVRKDCPALLTLVNDRLVTIIKDGRYAKLYVDFFGVKPPERLRP
jgi:ABC-type amino acid transport substrate-binding protein